MNVLINTAYVLLLVSFSVKSILWLRALNVVAGLLFVTSFVMQPAPLWDSIAWNLLFCAINVWRIWRTIVERRPPVLDAHEQLLHQRVFSDLSARDWRRLLDQGAWADGVPPDALLRKGEQAARLWMVAAGRLLLTLEDGATRTYAAGDFIGEGCFLAGIPAGGDVVIQEPVRFVSWDREDLQRFLDQEPAIGCAVQTAMGRGLVQRMAEG